MGWWGIIDAIDGSYLMIASGVLLPLMYWDSVGMEVSILTGGPRK